VDPVDPDSDPEHKYFLSVRSIRSSVPALPVGLADQVSLSGSPVSYLSAGYTKAWCLLCLLDQLFSKTELESSLLPVGGLHQGWVPAPPAGSAVQ
jgi:hypothetical protein